MLILTAIVVGVATIALGLALIMRINSAFGTIEEDDLLAEKQHDRAYHQAEQSAGDQA